MNEGQFTAQIGYDLERLSGLGRPWLGPEISLTGKGTSAASYRGPFSLNTGSAAANLRWDAASLFGVQLGPGEFKASMANGVAQIEPIDLTVSRGRVHLAPQLRLVPDLQLSLPKGPLAQQIQVDPSLCASTLKFLAPALAGVTTAQGSFTIELDDFNGKCIPCRIPLADPMKADLAGRLIIHSMDVGPGPMSSEMAVFLAKEAPAKLRPESVVAFQLLDGRIYHQGPGTDVSRHQHPHQRFGRAEGRNTQSDGRTAGAAEMAGGEHGPLAGHAESGPPRAHRRHVGQAAVGSEGDARPRPPIRQNVEKAATSVIQGEVTKQLDRLFTPQK